MLNILDFPVVNLLRNKIVFADDYGAHFDSNLFMGCELQLSIYQNDVSFNILKLHIIRFEHGFAMEMDVSITSIKRTNFTYSILEIHRADLE